MQVLALQAQQKTNGLFVISGRRKLTNKQAHLFVIYDRYYLHQLLGLEATGACNAYMYMYTLYVRKYRMKRLKNFEPIFGFE